MIWSTALEEVDIWYIGMNPIILSYGDVQGTRRHIESALSVALKCAFDWVDN